MRKSHVFGRDETYHGEFDPGSERTLAARFKHASRTAVRSNLDESGERVSNTWVICPCIGDSPWKHGVIPNKLCSVKAMEQRRVSAGRG